MTDKTDNTVDVMGKSLPIPARHLAIFGDCDHFEHEVEQYLSHQLCENDASADTHIGVKHDVDYGLTIKRIVIDTTGCYWVPGPAGVKLMVPVGGSGAIGGGEVEVMMYPNKRQIVNKRTYDTFDLEFIG